MQDIAIELAQQLVEVLQQRNKRLVLVESCTAGRVSSVLSSIPGVSQCYCGCFVVYRNASKSNWLDIPTNLLEDPSRGPVSQLTSNLLAQSGLVRTPEADLAVSVTGDVGPGAAQATDGSIFLSFATRQGHVATEKHVRLKQPSPTSATDLTSRIARLEEATQCVLAFALEQLRSVSK